jgi:hypothetical protein
MKDIFYTFLLVIIILFSYGYEHYLDDNQKQRTEEKFHNTILLEKYDDFISTRISVYDYNNDTIKEFRVYQIIYNKYETGDTIK